MAIKVSWDTPSGVITGIIAAVDDLLDMGEERIVLDVEGVGPVQAAAAVAAALYACARSSANIIISGGDEGSFEILASDRGVEGVGTSL